MRFLTFKLEQSKILKMDAEQDDEIRESTEQSMQEESSEHIPLSKLRDLRPEKDPIGAGHKRAPNAVGKFP